MRVDGFGAAVFVCRHDVFLLIQQIWRGLASMVFASKINLSDFLSYCPIIKQWFGLNKLIFAIN